LLGALAGSPPAELPLGVPLRPGAASGPLLGGCLSLLTATLGTAFFPDLAGAVLFWEEVNEPPYRVDRMLTHLGLSGNLATIEGMVVGHLQGSENCQDQDHDLAPGIPAAPRASAVNAAGGGWRELVADSLSRFAWPLAWGLEAGHATPNRTLPLGWPVRLEAAADRLLLG
jgi:muramoyltetrapeptide carboxypeptidase